MPSDSPLPHETPKALEPSTVIHFLSPEIPSAGAQ